jgi:hypothetical protein
LLDLVAIPLWDDVEAAEGDDPQVGREIVDVAALEALLILVITETSEPAYLLIYLLEFLG